MRLLLDTHIWIWSLTDPRQLTPKVALALEDRDTTELWLSSITLWEFLVLVCKNCFTLKGDPQALAHRRANFITTAEAPITHAVAKESERLHILHADPARD